MQDNKSQPLILAHSVKGQMSFRHGALSVVCPSTIAKIAIGTLINTKPVSDHRRIALAIQEYVYYRPGHPRVSSEAPKFRSSRNFKFPELQVPKFPELQVPGTSNNIC